MVPRPQVVQFVRAEEYARFSRIIFDTAPTGHTLRLLAVPEFVDASLGKIIRLRKKLGAAGAAVRGLFGASEQQDSAVQKLEGLRVSAAHPESAWIAVVRSFKAVAHEPLSPYGRSRIRTSLGSDVDHNKLMLQRQQLQSPLRYDTAGTWNCIDSSLCRRAW